MSKYFLNLISLILLFNSTNDCYADTPTEPDYSFGIYGRLSYQPFEHEVKRMRVLGDGKILLFVYVKSQYLDDYIVRINSNGTIDTTYGINGFSEKNNDTIFKFNDVYFGDDNKAYGFGKFDFPFIVRFNKYGKFDITFNSCGYAVNKSMLYTNYLSGMRYNNKIYVFGTKYAGTKNNPIIARYKDDGKYDQFNHDETGFYTEYPLFEGSFFYDEGNIFNISSNKIYKIKPDGNIDSGFAKRGLLTQSKSYLNLWINDVKTIGNDNYLQYTAVSTDNTANALILKFNNLGIIDSSFGNEGYQTFCFDPIKGVHSKTFEFEFDNDFLIAGDKFLARGTRKGKLDSDFGNNGILFDNNLILTSLTILDDQSFLVAGKDGTNKLLLAKFKGSPRPPAYITCTKDVICQGETITVDVTTFGTFQQENNFIMELSDKNGSFEAPIEIAWFEANQSCVITGILPKTIPVGDKYRIRLKSTNPETYSNDLKELTIKQKPEIYYINGVEKICAGQSSVYKTAFNKNFLYKWTADFGKIISPDTINEVTVAWETTADTGKITLWIYDKTLDCPATEDKTVKLLQLPVMAFDSVFNVCSDIDTLVITGGKPAGGNYFGFGLQDTIFFPAKSGAGEYIIYYTYENENQCKDTVSTKIYVHSIPEKPIITKNKNRLYSNSYTGNQWYKDGEIIEGATEQVYVVNESGVYSLRVETEFGCVSGMSDSIEIIIEDILSETKNDVFLTIIPNPVFGNATLNFNLLNPGVLSIEIVNSLGEVAKVIYMQEYITEGFHNVELNLNELTSGIYFCILRVYGEVITMKISIVN